MNLSVSEMIYRHNRFFIVDNKIVHSDIRDRNLEYAMTLGELIIALRNLEGVGANRGELHGPHRHIICYRETEPNGDPLWISDIQIDGSAIALTLSGDEQ
jgi:hypothetical protein